MKQVAIARDPSGDAGTFGLLTFGPYFLRSVELPWRDNTTGKSCIPVGTYQCALVTSPKFGSVYGVADVPGRSHVLIHAANFGGDEDKGYQTELLGCIAPVMGLSWMENNKGKQQRAGTSSRAALALLMGWAKGEPFELTITNAKAMP